MAMPGRDWNDNAVSNGVCREDLKSASPRASANPAPQEMSSGIAPAATPPILCTRMAAPRDRLRGPTLTAPAMQQTTGMVGSEIMIGSMAERQVPLRA